MKVLCRALALLLICTACSAAQARQTRHFTFEERGEVIGRLYRLGLENDRRHIGTFFEALKDRNPEVREAAIAQLVFTHDKTALEPVIEAMKDGSRQVRRCAIAVLERIGSPEAIPVLTEALTYRPPDYREGEPLRFEEYFNRLAAALALHRLGSDAGRATVLECLETQDTRMVQSMALKAVLYMDLKEAIPACIRIARDQQFFGEDSPGLFALRALWHVGDNAHRDEIVEVALEKNDSIGMHAPIWTLALLVKFGDEAAAQVFKDTLATTPHHEHQYQCILGLEKFKPEGGAELIVSRVLPPKIYIEETGEVQWAREYKVFKMACDALGTIGDKSAIPGIKLWYERYSKPRDHFFYRLHLASALARLEDPEGLAHLQGALTHEDAAVRRLTARLLTALGNEGSLPLLVEAVKKETEKATFEVMRAGIGELGAVPAEVAALPGPPAPPVPEDTYGQFRYLQGWFDDCATVEAMERISGLVEELATEDVRWVFTIYYAPLSRHDHEYHRVLVQRCFDRGCEIANHTMYHNPDGQTIRAMTDDELRVNLAGCSNWLRAYIHGLDKIYGFKGGGGGFRRPGDPVRAWRDLRQIRREANFSRDISTRVRVPTFSGWDMQAPPFHPGPTFGEWAEGLGGDLVSPRAAGDLRYAYDARDPKERIEAFAASMDYWYFHQPQTVLRLSGHDWPNSPLPDRPGNEKHWEILSGGIKEILLNRRDRYPLLRTVTNLELAHIFRGDAQPAEILTREVHLQTAGR